MIIISTRGIVLFSYKIRAKASSFHFLLYVNFGSLENESAFFGCLEKKMTKQQCVIYLLFWSICPNNGCLKIEWWVCDLLYTKRQLTFSPPSHWKKGPFFKGILDRTMFFVWLLKEIGKLRKLPAFLSIAPFFFTNKNKKVTKKSFLLSPASTFPLFQLAQLFLLIVPF